VARRADVGAGGSRAGSGAEKRPAEADAPVDFRRLNQLAYALRDEGKLAEAEQYARIHVACKTARQMNLSALVRRFSSQHAEKIRDVESDL